MIRLLIRFAIYGLAVIGALILILAAVSYLGFWIGAVL